MNIGGIQFEASEGESSLGYVPYKAFLFAEQGRFVGAAGFRYRHEESGEKPWVFDWLWIHPFRRRRGVLTLLWPALKAEVGEFRLAEPISQHMQGFLAKVQRGAA